MSFNSLLNPLILKANKWHETLVLGQGEDGLPLEISQKDRLTHMYVLGLTGSGKSKFLEALTYQDLVTNQPFTLLDPKGSLYWSVSDQISFLSRWHSLDYLKDPSSFWERFLFLDFTNPQCPLHYNPLEPAEGETTEDVVGDLVRALARLFQGGDLSSTRRMEMVLTNTLWVLCENRKQGIPLTLQDADTFLLDPKFHAQLLSRLDTKNFQNLKVLQNWESFFGGIKPDKRLERVESTLNLLQHFWRSSHLERFTHVPYGNLNFSEILNKGKTLLVNLPMSEGAQNVGHVLGTFLMTKLQRVAQRRKTPQEKAKTHFLYIDECHFFLDAQMAEAAAFLREFGLNLILCQQSLDQPPMNTPEGRGIMDTIKNNAFLKVIFRIGRCDAERLVNEIFTFTETRVKREWDETSESVGHGEITAHGTSRTISISNQESESLGKNTSVGHQHSTSRTETESSGQSTTISEQQSETVTKGITEGQTQTQGWTQTTGVTEGRAENKGTGVSHSQSEGQGRNMGWSEGENENQAFTKLGFVGARGPTKGSSNQSSEGQSSFHGTSLGQTLTKGITENSSISNSKGTSDSHSDQKSLSLTQAQGNSVGKSLGLSWTKALSFGSTEGTSVTTGESHSTTKGKSATASVGESENHSTSTSTQTTTTRRMEYYSLGAEKELAIQTLQSLPKRRAYVIRGGLVSEPFMTHPLPTQAQTLNAQFLERLLTFHLERFLAQIPAPKAPKVETPLSSPFFNL